MPYMTINSQEESLKSDKSISMLRLNPNQSSEKVTTTSLFPPHGNYFTEIINNNYKRFLKTDTTTEDGMMVVARHYGVQSKWKTYLEENNDIDEAEQYYKL
jgi:hypothetical protein